MTGNRKALFIAPLVHHLHQWLSLSGLIHLTLITLKPTGLVDYTSSLLNNVLVFRVPDLKDRSTIDSSPSAHVIETFKVATFGILSGDDDGWSLDMEAKPGAVPPPTKAQTS